MYNIVAECETVICVRVLGRDDINLCCRTDVLYHTAPSCRYEYELSRNTLNQSFSSQSRNEADDWAMGKQKY